MIRYTITAEDSQQGIAASAIIDSPHILQGSEPIIAQRIGALEPLLLPESEFTAAFKNVIFSNHKEKKV